MNRKRSHDQSNIIETKFELHIAYICWFSYVRVTTLFTVFTDSSVFVPIPRPILTLNHTKSISCRKKRHRRHKVKPTTLTKWFETENISHKTITASIKIVGAHKGSKFFNTKKSFTKCLDIKKAHGTVNGH